MCRLWISIVTFSKQELLICIFKCNSDIQAHRNSKFDVDRLISHISQNNTTTAGNRHKQKSRFCKDIREDNFLFWWRRVHEDASQGMYMSKIEICLFTARILQNQRMLCCGECFRD